MVVTPTILGNPEAYARAVGGLPLPRLGLNCVGGSIATSVSRSPFFFPSCSKPGSALPTQARSWVDCASIFSEAQRKVLFLPATICVAYVCVLVLDAPDLERKLVGGL